MAKQNDNLQEIATERIRRLVDFVADVYGLSYAELADALGINRGWFTRYRNGSIGDWGCKALFGLIDMCAAIDSKMLFDWLIPEGLTSD